jgi:hypothetical protein
MDPSVSGGSRGSGYSRSCTSWSWVESRRERGRASSQFGPPVPPPPDQARLLSLAGRPAGAGTWLLMVVGERGTASRHSRAHWRPPGPQFRFLGLLGKSMSKFQQLSYSTGGGSLAAVEAVAVVNWGFCWWLCQMLERDKSYGCRIALNIQNLTTTTTREKLYTSWLYIF